MDYSGILLVNKPKGWTSHDVVAKIRGILKKQAGHKVKVGHTGTLDPLAAGLMIVVTGNYCKRAQEFSKLDKTYSVIMKLGETSSTGDEEGEKIKTSSDVPSETAVKEAIVHYTATYEQIPPIYSAIKVNGRKAYEMARSGQKFKLEPRTVTIYKAELKKYNYPLVELITDVSSGTYIRSLVEDIGKKIGTSAYMSDLIRTHIGPFKLKDAISIEEVGLDKLASI
jgi:tRNA pseudouridine55 synthase